MRKIALILVPIAAGVFFYLSQFGSEEKISCSIQLVGESYADGESYSGWCLREISSKNISCGNKQEIISSVSRARKDPDRLPENDYKEIYVIGEFAIAFFDDDSGAFLWKVDAEWHDGRNTYFPVERLGMLDDNVAANIFDQISLGP